jgi:GDPmannose 4,6-dehydratase
MVRAVVEYEPHEIYNFGGISSIVESFNNPELTYEVNVGSVRALLAGIRSLRTANKGVPPRMITASSGAIFEGIDRSPQSEQTVAAPHSPYAKSKSQARSMLRQARIDENLFVASAILYNHESPLRGESFVTRKISIAVARISAGLQSVLELGDIEVARDWGWAPDYVRGMQLMASAQIPEDYVLATGISHRLSYFIDKAFAAAGIEEWSEFVVTTESNQRAADTNLLIGDSRKAYADLGWRHTVDFDSMAKAMVEFDMIQLVEPNAIWMPENS